MQDNDQPKENSMQNMVKFGYMVIRHQAIRATIKSLFVFDYEQPCDVVEHFQLSGLKASFRLCVVIKCFVCFGLVVG